MINPNKNQLRLEATEQKCLDLGETRRNVL